MSNWRGNVFNINSMFALSRGYYHADEFGLFFTKSLSQTRNIFAWMITIVLFATIEGLGLLIKILPQKYDKHVILLPF
jgi:hypothetical protein